MVEYRCISCGCIKESEKECACSECGYKMYPTPYVRKELLISEIQKFIKSLITDKIEEEKFLYYRLEKKVSDEIGEDEYKTIDKSEDDKRFPDLKKIQKYVCDADKTEKFIERLNSSLEQIKKHINTLYKREYIVDYGFIKDTLAGYEKVLKKVLSCFGETIEFHEFKLQEIKLLYSEIPDKELVSAAENVIDALHELVAKIYRFIRQNNIYGTAYNEAVSVKNEFDEDTDHLSVLKKTEGLVRSVLEKKYVVDIFSDGTDELNEMLDCLWNAVSNIMYSPILVKEYDFVYPGETVSKKGLVENILSHISARYAPIYNTVLSCSYFDSKTEDELFELYNKMVELDSFNVFGVNKSLLVVTGKSERKLESLIGLSEIKESIKKIKAYALSNKGSDGLNLHMCFYGNPGTGKTEVARIIADILYENKILPTNKVVEVDRGGLIGQYVGETPQKTMCKIKEAMGGVLFIDEAYALAPKDIGFDYGHEAIATLIKAMEDMRGKFCVILAGYKNQMLEMISANPGFKSRIQFELDFPNYSRNELREITNLMLRKRNYTMNDSVLQRLLDITDIKRRDPNFANAREIRNILDGVIMCQNVRTIGSDDKEIGMTDVNKYIDDSKINVPVATASTKILTAEDELDQLIGLSSVKRMVKKIKAFAKKNKNNPDFNMHMCFYGNPGTGKTEVARIISGILYDAGVLPEAKLIETDAHGLIGKFVGETAPKTQAKISDAMGGVLFIDEAYGLSDSCSSSSEGYGSEAIEVLLKNMEDHRGKFCTVLAGYKQEIKEMLSANPGFESRIQFALEFPDYSREELGRIAVRFLDKMNYTVEESALELFLDITDYYRTGPNFANARTVRNILDQVVMNQNLRTEDEEDNNLIVRSDVEDYLFDENIDLHSKHNNSNRIGFI